MERNKTARGKGYIFLFLLFCTFITALNASDNPFYVGVKLRDSSVFTFMGKLILQGGMPYRDSFDHKGPLMYLINALGLLISQRFGIWLIEFVTVFIILLFIYQLARMLECTPVTSCVVVVLSMLAVFYYFNWGNVTEEYACVFIILSLYSFVKYFRTGNVSSFELILCGFSFAAVCLLRINMAALWVVMCLGVLVHCIRNHQAGQLYRFIILFIGGAAILVVPVAVWLILNHAVGVFIKDYFLFNFLYCKSNLLHKINVFAVFCSQATSVLAVAPLVYFWIKERKAIDGLCLAASVFTLIMNSISGQNYQHYGLIIVPLFAYSAGRTVATVYGALQEKDKTYRRTALIAIACSLLLMFAQSFVCFSTVALPTAKKSQDLAADKRIAQIIKNNTKPEDKISVCGNNDRIYLLADRESASIYSYQYPLADVDSGIKKRYLADMKEGKAKIIVMDQEGETEGFLKKEMEGILDDKFTLLDSVGAADIYLLK